MIGTTWRREQGLKDALLRDVLRDNGYDDVPLYGNQTPEIDETKRRTYALGARRDGPVDGVRRAVDDPAAMAATIKAKVIDLGGDLVGIARIRPNFVDLGLECRFESVIAIAVHERYHKVLDGPRAVEAETYDVYYRVAHIATLLGEFIRDMGYPALAHHNGGTYIQAIPAMYHAGFGELGRHGSLINPQFGASFRPAFVTTDLPMTADQPLAFGVQDYCLNCKLCTTNCPGGAIPAEHIVTDGHRRWLTDMEKCYPYSRLRPDYCHLCVDVCPYIHKQTGEAATKDTYKAFMRERKAAGYGAPKQGG